MRLPALLCIGFILAGCATTHLTVAEAHSRHISNHRWEGEPEDVPIWSSDPKKESILQQISSKLRGG